MSETGLWTPTSVPSFDSIADLRTGLEAKKRFLPVDLYPRDGSKILGEIEAQVAELSGLQDDTTLIYATGMAAVSSALMVALTQSEKPSLAYADNMYNKTLEVIEEDISPFVPVHAFDSGDPDSYRTVIDAHRPSVVVAETIANSRGMPVLDIDALITAAGETLEPEPPTLVIDDTFSLSSTRIFKANAHKQGRMIVAMSGTKSYSYNDEPFGIAATYDPDLFQALREHRRRQGPTVGVASQANIQSLLTQKREEFDERNLRIFRNTGALALYAHTAVTDLGLTDVHVTHPGLPSHRNHELYRRLYPHGGSPVFFLHSDSINRWTLADHINSQPGFAQHSEISQSFGFDTPRILVDESAEAVRIAGGAETDVEALGEALAGALRNLKTA